jgi:hypothetical protein
LSILLEDKPKLKVVATTILGSEKAYGLYEVHIQSPDSSGFHRYQIIHVLRDGQLAEYREDMGLASKFKGVKQIRIPSYMEHSVDELKDMATYFRNETDVDVAELLENNNYKLA